MAQCYLLNIDASPAELSKNSGHKSFKEMLLVTDKAFDGHANKEKSVESQKNVTLWLKLKAFLVSGQNEKESRIIVYSLLSHFVDPFNHGTNIEDSRDGALKCELSENVWSELQFQHVNWFDANLIIDDPLNFKWETFESNKWQAITEPQLAHQIERFFRKLVKDPEN